VSGLHCNCAYDDCAVTSCGMCGALIPEADKRATQHDLCLPCKGARIPDRCQYKAGDRVIMQGSPRCRRFSPADHERTGFRGVVEGTIGWNLLIGLADDGREWCQQTGALMREPAAEQLDLFPELPASRARPSRRRQKPGRTAVVPVAGGAP
jgi:hypothetical protein